MITLFVITYISVLLQTKGYIFPYSNKEHLFIGNLYHLPRFVCYFLAGACCYFYRNTIPRKGWLALLCCVAVCVSFWWIKAVDQSLPLAGTYLLFYLVFHPTISFPNFTKYGDFSYGVYLYGWPVQALVMFYLGSYINPYTFFIIALPIALIAAFCSWHLIEKPFLKLKGKSFKKMKSSLAPAVL